MKDIILIIFETAKISCSWPNKKEKSLFYSDTKQKGKAIDQGGQTFSLEGQIKKVK